MRLKVPLLAATLIASAGASQAAEDRRELLLEPSSPWVMDYADDSCHLRRSFGEGKDRITAEFRQYGESRTFTLLVAGEMLGHSGRRDPFVTRFEPLGARQEHPTALSGELPDGLHLIHAAVAFDPGYFDRYEARGRRGSSWRPEPDDLEPIVPDRASEAKAERLHLTGPFQDELVLKLGPMDTPMDAMRSCIDELLTHWGIDAEAHRSLSRRAAPRTFPGRWISPDDFPAGMIRAGRSAAVHFRLMVDASGSPTACVVQTPTETEFDERTCRLLQRRAKFTPALDREGHPIPSYFTSSVTWLVH